MLSHDFPFDTVQMPLNALDGTFKSFTGTAGGIARAAKRGIAVLGMKSMGGSGEIVYTEHARKMARYAMSLPVATTISGMDSLGVLEQNLKIASASNR